MTSAPQGDGVSIAGTPIPDDLRSELEQLGLNPNQARLLLALLRLGPAKAPDLARVSGVPRTSIYPVLEELSAKSLAERVSGPGPAVWAAPGRDEILDRLHEAEQERLREHETRTERVRRMMAESFPDAPSVSLTHAHVIKGMAQVRRAYERMLSETENELVMFTRPPYTWAMGRPNPAVLSMLERGVKARVLYQSAQWHDPSAEAFRQEAEIYHSAGVEPRLTADLPIKLVVSDRRMALVAMTLEAVAEDGYPLTLWIEHPGYAAIHADAFEQRWADAQPLDGRPARRRRA